VIHPPKLDQVKIEVLLTVVLGISIAAIIYLWSDILSI